MRIGIDAMGGDNAPHEIIKGAIEFINKNTTHQLFLFGKTEAINNGEINIKEYTNIELIDCPEVIDFNDEPVKAIRTKKNSSIVKGFQYLKNNKIDAFISAGNTGALLAGATLIVGRIKGIDRPALLTLIPAKNGKFILIDAGSNADCKPINLVQFAYMSSIYMEKVLNVKNPTLGLLNIGTEEEKGNELIKTTHKMLKETKGINFIGNVEARDIPYKVADIVVCDGFVGNIALKLMEGMGLMFFDTLKEIAMQDFKSKIAGLLLKPKLKLLKQKYDYHEVGGAPLLGIDGVVFKCHGSSDAKAIYNGIKQAVEFYEKKVIDTIKENVIIENK